MLSKTVLIIGEYVEFIYCGCNCGLTRPKYDNRKREFKCIRGHKINQTSGENHHCWNGGNYKNTKGYNYKRIDKKYKALHRLVYEQYYNCCLLHWVDIHHIDENKDNNNINNLEPSFRPNHTLVHMNKRYSIDLPLYKKIDKCQVCGKISYKRKCGRLDYYIDPITKKLIICHNCYRKRRKIIQ